MKQETALKLLKSGHNVFITGSAGTGKTYLLNQFITYLKDRKVIPSIVASTGIAASHLKGQTVHAFFSLGLRSEVDNAFLESLSHKKYLVERFEELDVLIIDEVSMIAPELFTSMDRILRTFKEGDKAFGGVQVVISGDFFQLPPVSKEPKDKRFAWQSPAWKDLELNTCYLHEKYRQDDDTLISILDEIRSGTVSDATHQVFSERYNKKLDIDFTPTKLYTHNIDIDRINTQELEKLESEVREFEYESKGSKSNVEKIFKSALVTETLVLKKDAVVFFIKNNPEKGYLNGTTGIVTGFDGKSGLPIVNIASGKSITVEKDEWSLDDKNGKQSCVVTQVPLRLAWAMTIHKSQGMTLDAAEIDLSKAFEVGQGYVALSRLKNIEGLSLLGINDIALRVDPLILKIDDRIKQASEKSAREIEKLSEDEIDKAFESYMELLGGLTDEKLIQKQRARLANTTFKRKEPDLPSHEITKGFIEGSVTIKQLAKNRGVSEGTIVKHLSLLLKKESTLDIAKYRPRKKTFDRIQSAVDLLKLENCDDHFNEMGELRLKPVFEALNEEVSYDDIRVAFLFI
jgi:ATP-dependent DNA helicase PIF1